jgi:hypothetical protein
MTSKRGQISYNRANVNNVDIIKEFDIAEMPVNIQDGRQLRQRVNFENCIGVQQTKLSVPPRGSGVFA